MSPRRILAKYESWFCQSYVDILKKYIFITEAGPHIQVQPKKKIGSKHAAHLKFQSLTSRFVSNFGFNFKAHFDGCPNQNTHGQSLKLKRRNATIERLKAKTHYKFWAQAQLISSARAML